MPKNNVISRPMATIKIQVATFDKPIRVNVETAYAACYRAVHRWSVLIRQLPIKA